MGKDIVVLIAEIYKDKANGQAVVEGMLDSIYLEMYKEIENQITEIENTGGELETLTEKLIQKTKITSILTDRGYKTVKGLKNNKLNTVRTEHELNLEKEVTRLKTVRTEHELNLEKEVTKLKTELEKQKKYYEEKLTVECEEVQKRNQTIQAVILRRKNEAIEVLQAKIHENGKMMIENSKSLLEMETELKEKEKQIKDLEKQLQEEREGHTERLRVLENELITVKEKTQDIIIEIPEEDEIAETQVTTLEAPVIQFPITVLEGTMPGKLENIEFKNVTKKVTSYREILIVLIEEYLENNRVKKKRPKKENGKQEKLEEIFGLSTEVAENVEKDKHTVLIETMNNAANSIRSTKNRVVAGNSPKTVENNKAAPKGVAIEVGFNDLYIISSYNTRERKAIVEALLGLIGIAPEGLKIGITLKE